MDRLHPEVRKLIEIRGWSLSSIQESSMEDLVSGYDRVLVSPTGSGKTEIYMRLAHECIKNKSQIIICQYFI